MGTFRIMWENVWDLGSCLYSSQASADYAAANTQIRWPSRHWRTAVGQIAAQNIRQNLGAALEASCFIAWAHNYSGGSSLDLRIDANNADGWPGALDLSMPWHYHHIVQFFPPTTQPWWRHYIDDPTNADNYIRLGRCFLGNYIELTWRPSRTTPARIDPSTLTFSKGGQASADRVDRYKARAWDLTVTDDERLLLEEMFDEVGSSKPFFICEDSDDPNDSTLYVRLTGERLTFDPIAGDQVFQVRFEVVDER